mmetsp:Transcript_44207/g.126573  ORF Transcript_44207/g.126573 Transcript_44207/m.126573 type:complete len:241 (+) Transcript_44207:320-1042(+)
MGPVRVQVHQRAHCDRRAGSAVHCEGGQLREPASVCPQGLLGFSRVGAQPCGLHRPPQLRGQLQAQGSGRPQLQHFGEREGCHASLRNWANPWSRPRCCSNFGFRRRRGLRRDAELPRGGEYLHRARGSAPMQQRRPCGAPSRLGGELGDWLALCAAGRHVRGCDWSRERVHRCADHVPCTHHHVRGLRRGAFLGSAAHRSVELPIRALEQAHRAREEPHTAPFRRFRGRFCSITCEDAP